MSITCNLFLNFVSLRNVKLRQKRNMYIAVLSSHIGLSFFFNMCLNIKSITHTSKRLSFTMVTATYSTCFNCTAYTFLKSSDTKIEKKKKKNENPNILRVKTLCDTRVCR